MQSIILKAPGGSYCLMRVAAHATGDAAILCSLNSRKELAAYATVLKIPNTCENKQSSVRKKVVQQRVVGSFGKS